MRSGAARQRGVKANNTGCPALLQPRDEFVAAPDAQPAEIEDLELASTTLAQARDAFQGLDVVIEGRAHEDPDFEVVAMLRLLPVVKAMHQLLEPWKRQGAAFFVIPRPGNIGRHERKVRGAAKTEFLSRRFPLG